MSIFPKRGIRGSDITIHWNCNVSQLKETHITPFVRIGVIRPDGVCTMLMEENMLIYPDTQYKEPTASPRDSQYLKKSNPLLMLAAHLQGGANKEMLISILNNMKSGRHFYFTYHVPPDAPLGRYILLSEVISEGHTRYSKTAKEDFFHIEEISLNDTQIGDNGGTTRIVNHSPEPVSIRVCEYYYQHQPVSTMSFLYDIPGCAEKIIQFSSPATCILYNEERITLPVVNNDDKLVMRNQRLLMLPVNDLGEDVVYVWNKQTDETFKLKGITKTIWENADGLQTRQMLRSGDQKDVYDEMIQEGLIIEI